MNTKVIVKTSPGRRARQALRIRRAELQRDAGRAFNAAGEALRRGKTGRAQRLLAHASRLQFLSLDDEERLEVES